MPLSRRRLLLSLAGLVWARRPLRGQQEKTFSAEVKVVNVLATARDKKGEIVRNLNKQDFFLEEDGRPQTIRYFSQETDLPLTLGLVVDTSGSQRRVLGEERSASFRFLEQVLREDKDLAFVIHFDSEVELLQDLTSSRRQLESALDQLQMPQPRPMNRRGWPGPRGRRPGGTSLYDAVFLASDELMKKQAGRKAVIVLSDGVDNSSRMTLAEAVESAQRADTLVYSIRFFDEQAYGGGFGPRLGRRRGPAARFPQPPNGKKILEQISKATGGGFFEVSKKHSIDQIYSHIQEELRHQYSLGYTPDRSDDGPGYRRIRLTTRQKGLVVQARDGYYAQP